MSQTSTVAGTHTAVTTSGASTANNLAVAGTTAIANGTNLDLGGDFRLVVGFGSSPAVGAMIDLYMVYDPAGGTTYPDVDTSSTPPTLHPNDYVGSFVVVLAQTATQKLDLSVPVGVLGPYNYKCYPVNRSAQTMSSGWTLDFYGRQLKNA